MKRIIFIFLVAASASNLYAQSNSKNWIKTTTYTGINSSSRTEDIMYYDGFGRPRQSIGIGANMSNKDIITPIVYDAAGRESKKYLPYAATSNSGLYRPQAITDQVGFYNSLYSGSSHGFTYTENVYEASPLDHVSETYNVGSVFRSGNGIKSTFAYETNEAEDVLKFKVNVYTKNLESSGYYDAYALLKNLSTNEDSLSHITYNDMLGRTVLERAVNYADGAKINHDTYYVYDDYGNLCYVLPPKLSGIITSGTEISYADSDVNMKNLAYIYKYDGRNRCIEKRLPGTNWTYMIYDKSDRLVLTQDGNQRLSHQWTYFVYDDLNRVVEQSIVASELSRGDIQSGYASLDNSYSTLSNTADILVPNMDGFTFVKHLGSTRYGGYSYESNGNIPSNLAFQGLDASIIPAGTLDQRTQGLKTYEKVAILDGAEITDQFVERAFYYDYKGRVIQTVEKNHLEGISRYSTKYDFVGNVLATLEQHGSAAEEPVVPDDYEPLAQNVYMAIYPDECFFCGAGEALDPTNRYLMKDHEDQAYPKYHITSSDNADYYYIPEDFLPIALMLPNEYPTPLYEIITVFPGEGVPLAYLGTPPYPEDNTLSDYKLTEFTYDHRGRLLSETTTLNDGDPAVVEYDYDELGKLASKSFVKQETGSEIPVVQDWCIRYPREGAFTTGKEVLDNYISNYLSNIHGIDNWVDYEYFTEDGINPAYYIAPTEVYDPDNNVHYYYDYYYFPVLSASFTISHLYSVLGSFGEEYGGVAIIGNIPYDGFPANINPVSFVTLHESDLPDENILLTETYDYNIQGWLTEKKSDVFDMKLRYYGPESGSFPSLLDIKPGDNLRGKTITFFNTDKQPEWNGCNAMYFTEPGIEISNYYSNCCFVDVAADIGMWFNDRDSRIWYVSTYTMPDDKDYIVQSNTLQASHGDYWGFDFTIVAGNDYVPTPASVPVSSKGTIPSYTGNITEWEWTHKGCDSEPEPLPSLLDIKPGDNLRGKTITFFNTDKQPEWSDCYSMYFTDPAIEISNYYNVCYFMDAAEGTYVSFSDLNGTWCVSTFTMPDDRDYIVQSNSLPASYDDYWGFDFTTVTNTGNIAGTDNTLNTYAFTYDKLSRLIDSKRYEGDSTTPVNSFTERNLSYDLNGNILNLERYGVNPDDIENDFEYSYDGNRLSSLYDALLSTYEYDYDANGNMTADWWSFLQFEYNFLNLLGKASYSSGYAEAQYSWLADGTKVGVKDNSDKGYVYLGSLIYTRDGDDLTLESTSFGGGRIIASQGTNGAAYVPHYQICDHLGSVRTVFTCEDGELSVKAQNDYYPFGLPHSNSALVAASNTENRHLFNGKEAQTSGNLNLLDYGARMYNPVIGRWENMDKLSEKYLPISPYAYCANNPVKYIDPDGMSIDTFSDLASIAGLLAWARTSAASGNDDDEEEEDEEARRQMQMGQEVRTELGGMYKKAKREAGWGLFDFLAKISKTTIDFLNPVKGIQDAGDKLEAGEDLTLEDVLYIAGDIAVFIPGGSVLEWGASAAKASRLSKLKFAEKVLEHMDDPARFVPASIIDETIRMGKYGPDPKGSRALMYRSDIIKNGKTYKLEVLYDKKTNAVWHFKYE